MCSSTSPRLIVRNTIMVLPTGRCGRRCITAWGCRIFHVPTTAATCELIAHLQWRLRSLSCQTISCGCTTITYPLAAELRRLGLTNLIGYFHHIPWPAPEVLRTLPGSTNLCARSWISISSECKLSGMPTT